MRNFGANADYNRKLKTANFGTSEVSVPKFCILHLNFALNIAITFR